MKKKIEVNEFFNKHRILRAIAFTLLQPIIVLLLTLYLCCDFIHKPRKISNKFKTMIKEYVSLCSQMYLFRDMYDYDDFNNYTKNRKKQRKTL